MFTKQPMEYQPGKSRLIYMTGVPLSRRPSGNNKVVSQMGLFNIDSSTPPKITEGVYFRTDGHHLQWAETTQKGTKIVDQDHWNMDKFDGHGHSKVVFIFTTST